MTRNTGSIVVFIALVALLVAIVGFLFMLTIKDSELYCAHANMTYSFLKGCV